MIMLLKNKSIAQKYSVSINRLKGWLKEYKITARPKYSLKDLTGKRFGKLVALRFVPKNERKGKKANTTMAYWECKCDCGKTKIVATTVLRNGTTKYCGCLSNRLYKGINELSGSYLTRIKKGAKSRGLEFQVTKEYLWDLFVKQNKKCALSGISIKLIKNLTHNFDKQTASLDRIDNNKGYVVGNVQWIHKDINMMRRKLSINYFISLCKKVGKYGTRTFDR